MQLGDHDLVGKLSIGHAVDVLGIDPIELLGVEGRGVLGDAVERELAGQDIARDDRGLAVERPAEQSQVVDEGVGQVAGVAVLLHRGGAVALGKLGNAAILILSHNEREMDISRHFPPKRFIKKVILRR